METSTGRSKSTALAASMLFVMVAMFSALTGALPASAQTLNVHDVVLDIGDISVTWSGLESISDNHLTLTGATATGGDIEVGDIRILAMVDLFTPDGHLQMLLIQVTFSLFLSCTVTFHSVLLDLVAVDTYHNFFANASELGGVLYSGLLCGVLQSEIDSQIAANGVLGTFDIGH